MRTAALMFAGALAACITHSDHPAECGQTSQAVAMDDASLGFSGDDVVSWVGDTLIYDVTWEPEEALSPLPTRLEIQLGEPEQAYIVKPAPVVEGGCPAAWTEHLSVVRPYTLTLGDAVAGASDSESAAFAPDRIELWLNPDALTIAEGHQAAALASIQAQFPAAATITDYNVAGLFDLSAPTIEFGAIWEGSDPTPSGSSALWRSASMVRVP